MDIFLTVDVECYSGDYEREVHGNGRGLAYVLDACRRHGAKATFFVEALGATRWGVSPVQRLCGMIRGAGQDVQLHIHPVAAKVDGFEDRGDVLWQHDMKTQARLISAGMRVLRECGAGDAAALRAGDFAANEDTIKAMEDCGIGTGSNRDLDTRCSTRSRLNDFFPVRNDVSRMGSVIDVPVTALRSSLPFLDGRYRHMEISAMGLREMRDGLSRMAVAGYSCAGIFTHPAEYFRIVNGETGSIRKNCRRLEGLLEFVKSRNDMRMLTIRECAEKCAMPASQPPEIRANLIFSIMRVIEQIVDRMSCHWVGR